MADTATIIVFFAAALIVFCLCGALAERHLDRKHKSRDLRRRIRRYTS